MSMEVDKTTKKAMQNKGIVEEVEHQEVKVKVI